MNHSIPLLIRESLMLLIEEIRLLGLVLLHLNQKSVSLCPIPAADGSDEFAQLAERILPGRCCPAGCRRC